MPPRSDTCKRGHDLTKPGALYRRPDGYGECRICRKLHRQGQAAHVDRCDVGHDLTLPDAYYTSKNSRRCRLCCRATPRAYWERLSGRRRRCTDCRCLHDFGPEARGVLLCPECLDARVARVRDERTSEETRGRKRQTHGHPRGAS